MAAAPDRTELADVYPLPSNSDYKTGIGKLWDMVTGLLGLTGTKQAALDALRVLGPNGVHNLSLVPSVGASALTMNVKTRAAATPSADDPVMLSQRNATAGTGDFNLRIVDGALALVIGSGSTLGHVSAVPGPINWYLLDNVGVEELAASSSYFGKSGIVTTVAEGGAGGADSATVMYSATQRTNLPFRFIGRTIDTQTTAGVWAAVPTLQEVVDVEAPVQNRLNVAEAVGGTVDAITATFRPAFPSLIDKTRVTVRAAGANATTTPTLAVDGLTAKTIVKQNLAALVAGNIAGAGHELDLLYNIAADKWVLLNPVAVVAAAASDAYIYIRDEKASGTQGGTSAATTQTRVLNTEVVDTGSNATLASNQITLAAGTYRVSARAPAYVGSRHKIRLRNVTAGTTILIGSSAFSDSALQVQGDSVLRGRFTVAASQALELQHYIANGFTTSGLGNATSSGDAEVYAEIEFWKEP